MGAESDVARQVKFTPRPPVAEGLGMPWDVEGGDAVAAISNARRTLGDTFVVESGGDEYLFTFSPVGVVSFYALAETTASKGMADFRMLRRKLPDEIFSGRRTFPHQLFGRDEVTTYLGHLEAVLEEIIAELGEDGTVELFALTRRIGHRMGLASWGGPGAASGERFERLVAAFDDLDGSEAFVHPDAMAAVKRNGKAVERAALETIVEEIGGDLTPSSLAGHPRFAMVADAWSSESSEVARRGIALDVALIHIASMSNLVAALGWAVIDLLEHPDEQEGVRMGDRSLAERCALESTRLAQRSIMARFVMEPLTFDTGAAVIDVAPGATIATLLPLTNAAAPGYEAWKPDRWRRRRLADPTGLEATELVTVFGHGSHTCPAQPFALSVMTMVMTRLTATFDLDPLWSTRPLPVPAQIGGVARSETPCEIRYRRRAEPSIAEITVP